MRTLRGIAASCGIVIGPAFHFRHPDLRFERYTAEDPAAQRARLRAALELHNRHAVRALLRDLVPVADVGQSPLERARKTVRTKGQPQTFKRFHRLMLST